MNTVMDIKEILTYLPHRYPFLLIDRVIEMNPNKSIVALKNITINEAFFVGHFPNHPVMPGVLILEAMAQAAAVLAYKSTHTSPRDGVLYYFAGIDNTRFRRIVKPGDQLILKVGVLRSKRDVWKLEGNAYVDDELACSAEFMSARKQGDDRD
ncbi:MAG: 3-hydroxyacyl-[acyl-carrier-protein] dehydratase FabZ [Gammaproteobacteria bacterium RIFCSPHIGHO2_12_FULL_37_34]|nr:MAG: 3-hydroxyacyl-[acyl-carrier-protein] dehydratase FabZ [Gammaproteobacteria bacterium RIFCSPHIGHO2_12_FULL_37_34]